MLEVKEVASAGCPFAIVATVVAVVTCVALAGTLEVWTLNCQFTEEVRAALLSET